MNIEIREDLAQGVRGLRAKALEAGLDLGVRGAVELLLEVALEHEREVQIRNVLGDARGLCPAPGSIAQELLNAHRRARLAEREAGAAPERST